MTKSGAALVQHAQQHVPRVSCDELARMKEQDTDHVLLDVRTQEEFDNGHITDALHIPRGFLEFQIEEQVPERDRHIVVCCASGGRASLAAETLQKMGYTNAAYLEGGYNAYCANTEQSG